MYGDTHRFETVYYFKDYYLSENFLTITGSAGFGFIEDPFCLHRGIPPLTRDRLMLCLNYGLVNYNQQHDYKTITTQVSII